MIDVYLVLIIILNLLLISPFIVVLTSRKFLKTMFQVSIAHAQNLGFLISINGSIRIGKTSFQSGLSHILQILLQMKAIEKIEKTRKVYKSLNFNVIDEIVYQKYDEYYQEEKGFPNFDLILDDLTSFFRSKGVDIDETIIYNLLDTQTSSRYFEDYIFALWVVNIRNNYVQSKTKFYSHITQNISYDLNPNHRKIHVAYKQKDYSIYEYMVLLLDEVSDESGANKRFDDVKEEDGDKDFLRKFGQMFQEHNYLITTKQDVKDEIKKFRSLTQSNIWLPEKVQQKGYFNFILNIVSMVYSLFYFFYIIFMVDIPYLVKKLFKSEIIIEIQNEQEVHKVIESLDEYKDYHYKLVNLKRTLDNKLLYIDWFLFSISYNKYLVLNYQSEDDVKKKDPTMFDKQFFYIPTQFCFGTYDTHYYRNIQKELLDQTTTRSDETNWFKQTKYFDKVKSKKEDEYDEIDF